MRSFLKASMSQWRNMKHSQQQRVISEFRRQEEQREDQTKRITKDRQMQANLMSEERLEKKRYLRKVQDELHESQIEDALIKVTLSHSIHEKHLLKRQRGFICVRETGPKSNCLLHLTLTGRGGENIQGKATATRRENGTRTGPHQL